MVRWVSKTQEETEMARRGENIRKRKDGRWEEMCIRDSAPCVYGRLTIKSQAPK